MMMNNKVKSKINTGVEGLDQFSRAIAKYAEKAYSIGQEFLSSRSSQNKKKGFADNATVNPASVTLKVSNMRCKFALDHREKIIFLFCEYLTVEIENGRKEVEEQLKQDTINREVVASKSITKELLSLLHHAQQRGLKMDETFQHFDVEKNGYVDTDMLIDGMARLGMGVTYTVGQAVLRAIAGSDSSFFTVLDLERFLKSKAADLETFEMLDSTSSKTSFSPKKRTASDQKSKVKSAVQLSDAKLSGEKVLSTTMKQLLPPVKSELPHLRKAATQLEVGSHSLEFMDLTASQTRESESQPSSSQATSSIEMELPLPERAYSTLREEAHSVGLPRWALKRNRKALKELQRNDGKKRQTDKEPVEIISAEEPIHSKTGTTAASSSSSKIELLDLNMIANDVKNSTIALVNAAQSKDELLHVDHGVIMTYRVVRGEGDAYDVRKTHEADDVLRYKSTLEERERNLNSRKATSRNSEMVADEKDSSVNEGPFEEVPSSSKSLRSGLAFSLIIIPDVFMTLDVLEDQFAPLLKKYPKAQLVLVGLPGLPNTTWPRTWVLNSDLHARSLAKLLHYLSSKNIVRSDPAVHEPIFFVGFGAHCLALSRFVTLYLPRLPEVHYQTKSVTFINGILRYSKKFKQICKDLRQSMLDCNLVEVNELVTSLHFWDEYLTHVGRDVAMDKFWSSRRGLRMDRLGRCHSISYPFSISLPFPLSLPLSFPLCAHFVSSKIDEKAGLGYTGVLEQLKAIVIAPDDFDGASILLTNLPVAIVQATEDVFVDPKSALMFREDRLPPGRILVQDVTDCLDSNAVYVSWLKVFQRNCFHRYCVDS